MKDILTVDKMIVFYVPGFCNSSNLNNFRMFICGGDQVRRSFDEFLYFLWRMIVLVIFWFAEFFIEKAFSVALHLWFLFINAKFGSYIIPVGKKPGNYNS